MTRRAILIYACLLAGALITFLKSLVTAAKAQAFLNKRGGLLKSYHDPAFGGRSAAVDVGSRCPAGQPGVLGDEADQLVDSGPCAADGFDERDGAGCCRGDGHGFLDSCVMEFLLLPAGLCFRGTGKPARQPPTQHLRPTSGRSKRFTCRRRGRTVGQRRQPAA